MEGAISCQWGRRWQSRAGRTPRFYVSAEDPLTGLTPPRREVTRVKRLVPRLSGPGDATYTGPPSRALRPGRWRPIRRPDGPRASAFCGREEGRRGRRRSAVAVLYGGRRGGCCARRLRCEGDKDPVLMGAKERTCLSARRRADPRVSSPRNGSI